ncbi:MAG: cell division control protein Cdc6 [Thermoprotei archaeon]|nr:MAG: cell division control protein Cdc6 [Thermoprotei archaeon]RLF02746.1 MAG: cell division control protein Cdc6 [Thermoprotei archaeon]
MVEDRLEEIFNSFKSSQIYINREILLPDYVPDELPHRDKQIIELATILAPALSGSKPPNVFIYGLTGTGKTAVTKYVLRRLSKKAGGRVLAAYVNCRSSNTNYRVLAELSSAVGRPVPFTGLSTAEVLRRFVQGLEKQGRIMMAVLDEVDWLVKSSGDSVLYHLTRLNSELTRSRLSVIGITNDLRFMEYIDPRIKSGLGEEELVFPPYTNKELEDILRKRAELAFKPGVLEEGVIPLCAAIAAKQNGDCRLALDLLLKAADIAERERVGKVTEDHVRRAQRELEKNLIVDAVKTMPLHVKLILVSVYLLEKSDSLKNITTGEIYNSYREICKKIGVGEVTQRRVSEILSELDMLGIINARVVSLGRYGRTKIIKLAVSEKSLVEGLKSDPSFYSLIDPLLNMLS